MLAPRKKLHSSPGACVRRALELLELQKDDCLVDVGCGDGRVVVEAASSHGCTCLGIDINPERYANALLFMRADHRCNLIMTHVLCNRLGCVTVADRVTEATAAIAAADVGDLATVVCGNALELDLSKATAFYLFLIERGLRIMLPRLNELAGKMDSGKKLRVVCYLYKMPGVKPHRIEWVELPDKKDAKYPLYLYEFPVDVPAICSGEAAAAGSTPAASGTEEEKDTA